MLIEILEFLFYSTIIVLISKYLLVRILRRIAELLKLRPKTIGSIAGIATSIPELLTVSFSAFTGLIGASTYNIISSNIINFIQYLASVITNKNYKILKNRAIKVDLWLVGLTIVIPIVMLWFNIESNLGVVPFFIVLLFLFFRVTKNAHKLYGTQNVQNKNENEQRQVQENSNIDSRISVENYTKREISAVVIQGILLAIVGIILYVVGNLLGEVLNNLCKTFNVPEFILGVLLGLITSIPELITFMESQKHHKNNNEGVVEATGNLLTSNIMNLSIIQSVGIIIYAIFK